MSTIYSPTEVTKYVEKLVNLLNAEFEPELITVRTEPYAKINNCYMNVDEKVRRDGGKVHYGWAIFQTDIVCEAIRHAVWETEDEELIDITPRDIDCETIMFVSDNNFIYTGQLIDNVRVNSTNNPVVDDFIKVMETLEKFYTLGTRIDDEQMIVPEPAQTLIREYENLKLWFQAFLSSGGTPKSVCICGGPKQYNNCHGKTLKLSLEDDLKRAFKETKLN